MTVILCYNVRLIIAAIWHPVTGVTYCKGYNRKIIHERMILRTDTHTVDPGVAISTPVLSHTFVEIYHKIISTAILVTSADSRRVVISYKRNHVLTAQACLGKSIVR